MKKLFFALTCLFLAIPCQAEIIYVDDDATGANDGSSWADLQSDIQYPSIQAAIEAAVDGDTIILAPGTFRGDGNRDIDFKGKAITIRSTDPKDPNIVAATIIDCNGTELENHRGFYFHSGEDENSIVEGLTITNGFNGTGGGILCIESSPIIRNNIITGNKIEYDADGGAGIGCWGGASPLIVGNTISDNHCEPGGGGGGIRCYGASSPTITDNIIAGNSASQGGGICCYGSPTISNCTFRGNTATGIGGGILIDGSPILTNCTFSGNSADSGGAIYNYQCSPILTNCRFIANSAQYSGGAIFNTRGSSPTLRNCIFTGNTAGINGGAIYNHGYTGINEPAVVNCTFADNSALHGNALACDSYLQEYPSDLQVANCILWDGGDEVWNNDGSTITITYSDVQNAWPGEGNIDADPCFVEPGYWDPNGTPEDANDDFWLEGDYHLKSQAGRWDPNSQGWVLDDVTSPCIDAGNPGCPVGDEPAPNGNRINMGAYGGTAEASKSPANWRSIADMTNDWVVDSNDLRVYVDYWLESGECIPGDFDRSQFVDFDDFAIFGLQWSYPSSTVPGMTFHIDDCTMEAGQKWTAATEPNQPRFSVWVEGRYIYFEDQMYANCCPDELGLDKEINGSQITLYEIGYGGMCDCMCYFPIKATLGPFEDGIYTIEVYDNYGNSLGIVEVTIGGSTGPGMTFRIDNCDMFSRTEQSSQARFSITVDGLYVHFEDKMTANCCPDELGLEMTLEDNLITIHETEYTPGGCYCICDYPVTATLGPFEPGTYTLEVYEDWGGFIGSTTVVIDPPP